MGKTSRYFYAVRRGHTTGVFSTWDECRQATHGFSGAAFKKFSDRDEAMRFASGGSKPATSWAECRRVTLADPSDDAVYRSLADCNQAPRLASGSLEPATHWAVCRRVTLADPSDDAVYRSLADCDQAPRLASVSSKPATKPATKPGRTRPYSQHRGARSRKLAEPVHYPNAGEDTDGRLVVYTDGASSNNGQKGARAGVGVYFGLGDPRNVSEPLAGERQTNQRAELTAVMRALQITPAEKPVCICTDSTYSIKCLNDWPKGWERRNWTNAAGRPVENQDIIRPLLSLVRSRSVKFVHVRGHQGIPGNEAADALAVAGVRRID